MTQLNTTYSRESTAATTTNHLRFNGLINPAPFMSAQGAVADGGCIARCGELPVKFPTIYALVTAVLYYTDWGTDVSFAVELASPDCAAHGAENYKAPPDGLYIMVIGVMALHLLSICVADLYMQGGMGRKGVVLNLLNVRVLLSLFNAVTGDGSEAKAAAKTTSDVKLFEAVIESMPQLHLQYIVLFYYSACLNNGTIYFSLAVSTVSIVFAVTTKFAQLYGRGGEAGFTVVTALYFLADTTSRGVAVAMFFGSFGVGWLGLLAGLWVCGDLLVQWLQGDWTAVEKGETCGMRCCWDAYGDCCMFQFKCGSLCDCSYGWLILWHTTVAGPYTGTISIPAGLLSLFTAMPLSTRDGDRDRLFVLSMVATLGMVSTALRGCAPRGVRFMWGAPRRGVGSSFLC